MSAFSEAIEKIRKRPLRWAVTGVAGFIGSGILEVLLRAGQEVVGLDNYSTGKPANLDDVRRRVETSDWARFSFHEGDVRDPEACRAACDGVDIVLHQAALGSVPRSMENPIASHESNVTGTLRMLIAARDAGISRFVFASSSSVYGDEPSLPKIEARTGTVLSPYAATKTACESYLDAFRQAYGVPVVALRYFNVFGPRQSPDGPYAAVIPRWIGRLMREEPVEIYGDGHTSRDFCYLSNAVQANILAARTREQAAIGEVFNIAVGERTTLNGLFGMVRESLSRFRPEVAEAEPVYRDFRPGDVRHSLADVRKAHDLLGYAPTHTVEEGIDEAMEWYVGSFGSRGRGV